MSRDNLKPNHFSLSDDEWSQRVEMHWKGRKEFVKVTRQNNETWMLVRCKGCGSIKEINSATLRKKEPKTYVCAACHKIRAEQLKSERTETKEQRKVLERFQKEKQSSFRFCDCGQIVLSKTGRLCPKCQQNHERQTNRRHWKKKELKRRRACMDGDWSISLEKLYDRDKGICHICGEVCDWSDKTNRNGTIIAGNKYPSIDHVIALANGGKHEWNNVRLAHRICNSIKSDNNIPGTSNLI